MDLVKGSRLLGVIYLDVDIRMLESKVRGYIST